VEQQRPETPGVLLYGDQAMRITRFEVRNLRRLADVAMVPSPGLNLILGDNGAGKTSLLEAIHLLAYGRSFMGRVRDGLVRSGSPALEVFAEWDEDASPRQRRAGLRHSGQTWEGRLDGESVAQLGELCAALAAVSFEPGSHALVNGGGESRRRYVDWGLFHVEPGFLPLWRRYARALKQRNSLLKQRAPGSQLDAWDRELAEAGEPITRFRQEYLFQLHPVLQAISHDLVPSIGDANLEFLPGWRHEELSLADALLLSRERDLMAGYTSAGPHRADWRLRYAALPNGETLSRGQAKLSALACILAQAEHHAALRGEWPIVLMDDLASELDRNHQARVLKRLAVAGAQVFITGTEFPQAIEGQAMETAIFRMEQGALTAESKAPNA
jgi:DNA replication and repair protein RecF